MTMLETSPFARVKKITKHFVDTNFGNFLSRPEKLVLKWWCRHIFFWFSLARTKTKPRHDTQPKEMATPRESFEERKRKLFSAIERGAEETKKRKSNMFGKRSISLAFNAVYVNSKIQKLSNPQTKLTSMTFATIIPMYPYSVEELNIGKVSTNGGYFDEEEACFSLHGTPKAPAALPGQKAQVMPLSLGSVTEVSLAFLKIRNRFFS